VEHRISFTSAVKPSDPTGAQVAPGVTLWDSTIHYNIDQWVLQLNFSNLFDKEYVSRCSSDAQCFYGLRRVVMGTVTRKF